jgi:predicted transcriptional regulator
MRGAVWLELNPAIKTLEWKDAYKTMKRWQRKYNNKFKLCTYPNETLTMQEINNLLTLWERQDGFVPDVILIDYADILAPDYDCNRLDGRGQINRIWQRMRKLSQEKHCLLITATQAAASSYDKETLSLSDFSEDKRKYAHTTATYSLNQTDEEKKIGIMRLGELVIRESEFDRTRQVKVLQCLQRGRPFIGSYF